MTWPEHCGCGWEVGQLSAVDGHRHLIWNVTELEAIRAITAPLVRDLLVAG